MSKVRFFERPPAHITLIVLGILTLCCAFYTRFDLLRIPFERDEGGFTYIAQQLWRGGLLYTQLPDSKPPLLYLIYALFTGTVGFMPAQIHLGAAVFHILTLFLLWKWLKERLETPYLILTLAVFSLYSISWQVAGFAAHATQLLALPAMAGCYFLWQSDSKKPTGTVLAGLCFGLAFCIKQQAFFLPLGGLAFVWTVITERRLQHLITLGVSAALPFAACMLWFMTHGRFSDFWDNVFIQPAEQAMAFSEKTTLIMQHLKIVTQHWWLVWAVAVTGFVAMLRSGDAAQKAMVWFFLLSLAGVFAAGPSYPHYFVLSLPWLAIGFANGVKWIMERAAFAGVIVAAAAIGLPIAMQPAYWFKEDENKILRMVYGVNPFPEMKKVGLDLFNGKHDKDEKIAVLGSEPEVFVYAQAQSALRQIFHYGLLAEGEAGQKRQNEYLSDWNAQQPNWVVLPSAGIERFAQTPAFQTILKDLKTNYRVATIVDIYPDHTDYNWDPKPTDTNKSTSWVLVFEKK